MVVLGVSQEKFELDAVVGPLSFFNIYLFVVCVYTCGKHIESMEVKGQL